MIDETVKIWQPANVYPTAKIGAYTQVGSFSEVGNEVIVGKNVKIGKGCFLCEGVIIKDNVFLGPHVCFTNDKIPPSPRESWLETVVDEGAALGAGVTVVCGVRIGKNAKVGSGSVVTKSIPDGEVWCGNPARKLR